MDLSDLRTSLFLKDIKTKKERPVVEEHWETHPSSNVALEIIQRHQSQNLPESKQICLILSSVLDALKEERVKPSPTAIFASLVSLLEEQGSVDAGASAAVCEALSQVLVRVPTSVLKKKCVECSRLFHRLLQDGKDNAGLSKACVSCLGQMIAACSPQDWTALTPSFQLLFSYVSNSNPKLRKRAETSLIEVFAAFQDPGLLSALTGASQVVQDSSERILSAPEQTAREAARAPNKKRREAEENIKTAVAAALRFMSTLNQIVPLLTPASSQTVCGHLLSLYPLQQPLLSSTATEILLTLSRSTATVSAKSLHDILSALVSINSLWQSQEATLDMSLIKLLESLSIAIYNLDRNIAEEVLPSVVSALIPQLASRVEGTARAASIALINIFRACICEEAVAKAATASLNPDRRPSNLQRIIVAVESSFGAQYFESWELSLSVASELIQKLGLQGGSLAGGIIDKIGELCAGVEDIEAEETGDRAHIAGVAQNTLGVCIRSLGPEIVLERLPLELEEALDGQSEGRTWMIPLLKIHMRGGRIRYWLSEILPLTMNMEKRKMLSLQQQAHSKASSMLNALELQLWGTLPSFASWAQDSANVFQELTETISGYFQEREDLRLYISQAIQKIASQEAAVLSHYGAAVSYKDPCSKNLDNEFEADDDDDDPEFSRDKYVGNVAREDADATLLSLRQQSRVWLPLLLNAFVNTHTSRRGHLQSAISSYACLCDKETISSIFKSAVGRLIKVSQQRQTGELGRDAVFEGGDSDTERYCTYMEAIYALMGGLPTEAINIIYKIILGGIEEKDPAVQKKAYKLLDYIIEDRPDFTEGAFASILSSLLNGSKAALSASRGFRIRCLKTSIIILISSQEKNVNLTAILSEHGYDVNGNGTSSTEKAKALMMPMISEIVMSIKESNKKTRAAAFDLLVEVASELDAKEPEQGIISLVHLILGGLVGSTAQMVSATVMALARLLFEFTPSMVPLIHDLMPAVLMLLRSKARVVIKAVLGFLRVAVTRLDRTLLLEYTPQIVEGLLINAEDSKNKFRHQVRVVLERLAKKVGFEPLEKSVPVAHISLLAHIRKQMNRRDRMKHGASEMDWDERSFADTLQTRSRRSQAQSAWHSDIFSEGTQSRRARSTFTDARPARRRQTASSLKSAPGPTSRHASLQESHDPLNLLEASTSRRMVGMKIRSAGHAGTHRNEDDDIQFASGEDGRLIIKEEGSTKNKRIRDDFLEEFDSDDSDIEDIKGISGASLALRGAQSLAKASSYAGSILGASSVGGRRKGQQQGSHHSGQRFKAKKNTAGDVKGRSSVEPYAYWPLDRKMLNRRHHKTRSAKAGLDRVVNAARDGAVKGRKAKRRRAT